MGIRRLLLPGIAWLNEYNPTWTFEGGIQNIDLLFRIGKRLASESSWPKWKSDSGFKPIRDKEMSDK